MFLTMDKAAVTGTGHDGGDASLDLQNMTSSGATAVLMKGNGLMRSIAKVHQ